MSKILNIVLGTFLLGAAASSAVPHKSLRFLHEGVVYDLDYVGYEEPRELDLSLATGRRDTPETTLLSYYAMLGNLEDYQEVTAFTRLASGAPGRVPEDAPGFVTAARQITSGKIWIHGEILFDEYTIYLYRYEKSIPRLSGLPIRRFGEEYFIVQDLALVHDFVGRMSAARWDVETLEQRYPAPALPSPPTVSPATVSPPTVSPAVAEQTPSADSDARRTSQNGNTRLWWLLGIVAIAGISGLALYLIKR